MNDWCYFLSKFFQDNRFNTIWPGALSGLRFESSLRIPFRSMLISGILG